MSDPESLLAPSDPLHVAAPRRRAPLILAVVGVVVVAAVIAAAVVGSQQPKPEKMQIEAVADPSKVENLDDYSGDYSAPAPSSSGGQKRCVWMHGVGVDSTAPNGPSFPAYWGNVQNYATQCSENIFIHQNTVSQGWDSTELQQFFCNTATFGSGTTISDVVVFTHSMGNMIVAGAIMNGYCDFDQSSASWYSANAPWRGSKVADVGHTICAGDNLLSDAASALNFCPNGQLAQGYTSCMTTYPGVSDLMAIAQPRIKGAMCGTSAYGFGSLEDSLELEFTAEEAGYGTELNDGVVGLPTSCQVPGANYVNDASANYYAGPLNHLDGTCRNGNGDDAQPCNWYTGKL